MGSERLDRARTVEPIAAVTASGRSAWRRPAKHWACHGRPSTVVRGQLPGTSSPVQRPPGRCVKSGAGHAGAGLRRDGPQEPGLGVFGRGDPCADAALRDAEAEPALHRGHAGQAAGGAGGTEEGGRHRGTQRLGTPALVEAGRVVGPSDGWCGIRLPRRCRGTARIAVDPRDAVRITAGR